MAWMPARGATWWMIVRAGMERWVCRELVERVLQAERRAPRRQSIVVSRVRVRES